jgi:hypothetical protein
MSFQCPHCTDQRSLEIETSIQLFKGHCESETTLQIVECRRCQFVGAAVYEEGRRGAVDTRAWKHNGYFMDEPVLNRLKGLLLACPDRGEPNCTCTAHLELGICDGRGHWVGLEQFNPRDRFAMRLNIEST